MANCSNCNDSGKTHGSNDLDCRHCIAAQERSLLNRWLHTECGHMLSEDRVWAIYQRGKAAEADVMAPVLRGIHGWAIEMLDMAEFKAWPDADRADFMLKMRAAEEVLKNYPRKA